MKEVRFKPFGKQEDFLFDEHRVLGAFAGKRGGKTEGGAVKSLMIHENKPNYTPNGIDPYLGVIAAPTFDMLRRLSWKKFNSYAKHFIKHQTKNPMEIEWHDHDPDNNHESLIYGISADKPERLEGLKCNWIWIDEVFQVKEQFFLECLARLSDQQGYLICTGSLGVQFINPKLHWAHYYFKEHPDEDTACYEWTTSDNPHFPKVEIEKLKNKLDPQTFRSMFELNWDVTPKAAVYSDFSNDNVMETYSYNDSLPTYVCVDWGWAHPMAVGWFQYDEKKDTVYLFDEIVKSNMTIQQLYAKIKSKPYRIDGYYCDIAGTQEREQTGLSNVKWFREKGIHFKYRSKAINYGIPIVRSYIKNSVGRVRFYVAEQCKKSIDGLKQYRYPEKDGMITKDLPLKENDDACFQGLTLIHTSKGYKFIKDIKPGEYVLTRNGYKKVTGCFSKGIKEVNCYLNNTLCTPDHRFWINDNQFKRIDSLTSSDIFYTISLWQNLKKSYTMGFHTTFMKVEDIIRLILEENSRAMNFFIGIFGKKTLEIFHQVIMSIIKTAIHLITALKTLNWFMVSITFLSIQKKDIAARRLNLKIKNTLMRLGRRLSTGISQKKAGLGILKMLENVLLKKNHVFYCVSIALKNFIQKLPQVGQHFALANVNLRKEGIVELTTLTLNVSFVMPNSKEINMEKEVHVQKNVLQNLEVEPKKEIVYNLVVEDDHEYFANNRLVANCDMIRYFFHNRLDSNYGKYKSSVERIR